MAVNPFGKKSFVGLDIGHHTIKAVQVDKTSHGGWKITRTASTRTPVDSVKESVVVDPHAVAASIKSMLKEAHMSANSANIAVSGSAVVVRSVRIPKMPEATLRKSIKYEAGRYVPSSVEDSYIEFEITGDYDEAQMDVLMVAAPKDIVESRVKACELAGLEVEAVDVEPFAAYRSLVEADPNHDWSDSTIALVDIGAFTTSMSVVTKGVFSMTRIIPQGSQMFTDALKNYFKLNEEDAESGKAQLDMSELIRDDAPKENPPLRVVQPHLDDLIREVRRSLNYFQSQQTEASQSKQVDAVLLSGGGAQMPGLAEYVAHKLAMKTVCAGVLDNPAFEFAAPAEPGKGLDIAVASGLAMRAAGKAA